MHHDSGHLSGPVGVVEQEENVPTPLGLDAVGTRTPRPSENLTTTAPRTAASL